VGDAVKVTDCPAQMVVADAEMEIVGVKLVLTVRVIKLDVAVTGEAQASLEVKTQLTTSPLAKPLLA
jgi:hypothetical protein